MLSAGGTAVDVLGIIHDINARTPTFDPLGCLDDAVPLQGTNVEGLPVLGVLADCRGFEDVWFVNCLGSPNNPAGRRQIVEQLGIRPDRFVTITHPSAVISPFSQIGPGSIVFPFAFIGSHVSVGRQALIMAHASINHDAAIGEFSIVASSAVVLGRASVGAAAYVGAGAVLRQGIHVGEGALVGMGSTVLDDVEPNAVVAGTPARYLRPAKQT